MKLWTRDWLDCKELRRCSLAARGLLTDLMAIAHEGVPYGYLRDSLEPLPHEYLIARCHSGKKEFEKLLQELLDKGRIVDESGVLVVPRMVEDERKRQDRIIKGLTGGNPKLKVNLQSENNDCEGIPGSSVGSRARAASDSGDASGVVAEQEEKSQTRASLEVIPHPEAEAPEFQAFLAVFAGLGVALSQHDADKTCRLWISLEPPERAVAYYYAIEQAKGPWGQCGKKYIPRPWNYLPEKHWTRISFAKGRDGPATKGETTHETAARMFRKRQEESSV